MISGIGTDIVAIERFQRFVNENNTALLQRIFTEQERAYCSARKVSCAASYSARFAAKEAFMKALGTGLRDGISWHDIEVANNKLGKPELILSGKAMQIFLELGLNCAFLSLSHDGGTAVAMVVLEKL
jgi:holo-[acyl-carrier protein] synthase